MQSQNRVGLSFTWDVHLPACKVAYDFWTVPCLMRQSFYRSFGVHGHAQKWYQWRKAIYFQPVGSGLPQILASQTGKSTGVTGKADWKGFPDKWFNGSYSAPAGPYCNRFLGGLAGPFCVVHHHKTHMGMVQVHTLNVVNNTGCVRQKVLMSFCVLHSCKCQTDVGHQLCQCG